MLTHGFAQKMRASAWAYECVWDCFIVTPLCVCVCVSFALHWEFRAALFFAPFSFSHQYFTPSPPLLSVFLSLPLSFLGHRNEVFYLCSTTHYWRPGWLAGWLEFRWDSMSCVWCSKETATARWLQTALLLFVFNLYSAMLGWQGPAPHSGVVQCNHSLWHRAI